MGALFSKGLGGRDSGVGEKQEASGSSAPGYLEIFYLSYYPLSMESISPHLLTNLDSSPNQA